jgi:hypothetical protein
MNVARSVNRIAAMGSSDWSRLWVAGRERERHG